MRREASLSRYELYRDTYFILTPDTCILCMHTMNKLCMHTMNKNLPEFGARAKHVNAVSDRKANHIRSEYQLLRPARGDLNTSFSMLPQTGCVNVRHCVTTAQLMCTIQTADDCTVDSCCLTYCLISTSCSSPRYPFWASYVSSLVMCERGACSVCLKRINSHYLLHC